MSEEKKDGSCSTKGCGCCSGSKLLVGLLVGALVFAAGMWFAKANCLSGKKGLCHMSSPVAK